MISLKSLADVNEFSDASSVRSVVAYPALESKSGSELVPESSPVLHEFHRAR
jgi:hypothetical protein